MALTCPRRAHSEHRSSGLAGERLGPDVADTGRAMLGAPLGELQERHIRGLAADAVSEASDLEFKGTR
jgi:hypothetical protein